MILAVVRTANWGLGAEEDVWQVELLGTAKVHELKAKIEELYDVPQQTMKLSLEAQESAPVLEEDSDVEALLGKRVYMNPAPLTDLLGGLMGLGGGAQMETAFANMTEAFMGAAREADETGKALLESLQGVTYKVTFERPQDAGGAAAGKRVKLDLDALAQLNVVQEMVEVELFGAVGKESAHLVYQGRPLPYHSTVFHAGIQDGGTVTVSKDPPPHPAAELMNMLAAAAGDPGQLR